MGYNTDFSGSFTVTPKLTDEHVAYLNAIAAGSLGRHPNALENEATPSDQPESWCQWIPTEDGEAIEWDGNEKFYNYEDWLRYLIDNFLRPWGHTLNGIVDYFGEDPLDLGRLIVRDNKLSVAEGHVVYSEEDS